MDEKVVVPDKNFSDIFWYIKFLDMETIEIHVMHCGSVRTTRWLPYNKEHVGMPNVAGLFVPEKVRGLPGRRGGGGLR